MQDGANVYSGSDGGFNMKAEEALFQIDLVQSGASGGKFAIAGSVAYIGQTSDTLVRLGATDCVGATGGAEPSSPGATHASTPATSRPR